MRQSAPQRTPLRIIARTVQPKPARGFSGRIHTQQHPLRRGENRVQAGHGVGSGVALMPRPPIPIPAQHPDRKAIRRAHHPERRRQSGHDDHQAVPRRRLCLAKKCSNTAHQQNQREAQNGTRRRHRTAHTTLCGRARPDPPTHRRRALRRA